MNVAILRTLLFALLVLAPPVWGEDCCRCLDGECRATACQSPCTQEVHWRVDCSPAHLLSLLQQQDALTGKWTDLAMARDVTCRSIDEDVAGKPFLPVVRLSEGLADFLTEQQQLSADVQKALQACLNDEH
jgi:hypothetical protein